LGRREYLQGGALDLCVSDLVELRLSLVTFREKKKDLVWDCDSKMMEKKDVSMFFYERLRFVGLQQIIQYYCISISDKYIF